VFGAHGLCAQRNRALAEALARSDIITFFDDDFLPAPDYLKRVEEVFTRNPDWAVLRGDVILDGANTAGVPFEEGIAVLETATAARLAHPVAPVAEDTTGGYGCNMSVRAAFIGDLRFDERLALYGWQEDIDFTSQMGKAGRVVMLNTLYGVHLGVKAGRVSGVRFGYSQVINPVYLVRKGTVPLRFALNLIWRNIAANLVKSLQPEPYVDRRGRLKGNLLGAAHLLRGRIEPEYILQLQ
jgi:GT2 family glycosyltransferase